MTTSAPAPATARRFAACLATMLAAVAVSAGAADKGFRKLAPGVLTVIPPDTQAEDALLQGDLLEITRGQAALRWTPQHAAANTTLVERARALEYPRDIWCLEFAFKPPRQLDVELPAADKRMRLARIWYFVYRVKNVGGRRLLVGRDAEGKPDVAQRKLETFQKPIRFLPHFVLESLEPLSDAEGLSTYRAYLDRVVPAALDPIRRREDPSRRFFDSAEMAATEIAPGEERWGVAVWEGVDPRIDFFSIYVRGLTNAIRWRQRPGSRIGPDDRPGAAMEQAPEALRLDFWRPGDAGDGADQQMSVGFAGMFERMALGGRLQRAVGWPEQAKAQPLVGLDRLGLGWSDLVEPTPLETILVKLAAIKNGADRAAVARELFGDLGVESITALVRAASGPLAAQEQAARTAALARLRLTSDAVKQKPLESLIEILAESQRQGEVDPGRLRAAVFGAEAWRIAWLDEAAEAIRTLATIQHLDVLPKTLTAGTALDAFVAIRPAIDSEADAEARERILQGLFGGRGPDVYARAVKQHEGVDHAWVSLYERDGGGL